MFNLNQQYNRENFLVFLQNSFLPDDFDIGIEEILIDRSFQKIKKITKLGEVKSLGKNENQPLSIYEIKHQSESDPRVTLTKEAFWIMKNELNQRALIVFYSERSNNYRLSLMTIDLIANSQRVITKASNPKRYSFYLGPDAKIRTPQDFLIKKGKVSSFDDLLKRFSVEVVTKEFFNNYKKLFKTLIKYLDQDKNFKLFANKQEIGLDNFAKKLLGQIVFIYFIQKKKWLGAQKEEYIHKGSSNFLRNLYTKCESEKKNYFNDVLEYLFYDAFNKEPERAGSFYREYFDCQIPFLNGGLFEPLNGYDWESKFLHIPNDLFSNKEKTGILDIFDLYNFTIDENSLIDQEVSVDPEMLGKVFEKLLDTNKETGSFYTPREIVSYMVKRSLIEYLKIKTEIKKEEIEKLVSEHCVDGIDLNKNDYKSIEAALKEVKIIDPAVGSGAFPVGILREITEIRLICQSKIFGKTLSVYSIKKQILENNIYGVDIDHGAIDIARLRFWLSLIVDADLNDIEPLPNLEFKLVAANTLLSLRREMGLWDKEKLLEEMERLREKYFRARTKNGKEKIQNKFKKLINKNHNLLTTERQKQIITYNPFSTSSIARFFDSEFMFGIKDGFNIVIGNPPYVSVKNLSLNEKNIYKTKYKSAKQQYDLFSLFFEQGFSLLSKNGILAFITPNRYLNNLQYGPLRKILFHKKIIEIVNIGDGAFENVNMPTCISIYANIKTPPCWIFKYKTNFFKKFSKLNQKNIIINNGYSIRTTEDESGIPILKKIENKTIKLREVLFNSRGVEIGKSSKLICDKKKKGAVSFLVGSDISKYTLKQNKFLKLGDKTVNYKNKNIYNGKKILVRKTGIGINATIDNNNHYVIQVIYIFKIKPESGLSEEYLLSIINSKLIEYWYFNVFGEKNRTTFPHLTQGKFLEIPIKKLTPKAQKPFINIINKILKITSQENYKPKNPPAEQKELEKKLNEIVMNLYSLTNKEKEIIRSS